MLDEVRERLAGRDHHPFYDRVAPAGPVRRYLIATTGRAGSTLLCSRIGEYGPLGFPDEFLNEAFVWQFERLFPPPSLADFERFVAASYASQDGVFGMKIDWWRFFEIRKSGQFRSLYEPLDLAVYLRRDDFVAQAVSLTLAVETELWHVRDTFDGDLESRQREVPYDAGKIEVSARNILNQEYYWQQFLAGCGARRVDLTYEALNRDVDAGVQAIADAFDLRLARKVTPPKVEKARSSIASAWRERFEAERADFIRFWSANRGKLAAQT